MTILYFSTMGMKKCVLCKTFSYSINCYTGNENSSSLYLNLLSVEVTNQKSPLIASTELFSCFYVDWSAIEVKLLQKGSIHGSTMYILLETMSEQEDQKVEHPFTISPHNST